jgi:DNA-binding XRE family transcriptional regulator
MLRYRQHGQKENDMKSYQIIKNSLEHVTVSGKNLEEAIGNNLTEIVKMTGIGNVAGFDLDDIRAEKTATGAKLYVTAHGSDTMPGYDPTDDAPSSVTLDIEGASDEDFPVVFTIGAKSFDPMHDDLSDVHPSVVLGTIMGLSDEVAKNHASKPAEFGIAFDTLNKYPNLTVVDLPHFCLLLWQRLTMCKQKQDKTTDKIMERIDLLIEQLQSVKSIPGSEDSSTLWYYKTKSYFDMLNKVTMLAKLRKDAGLTQQQLADKVGITWRQIAKYEDAKGSALGNAKYSVVERLADILGVETSQLVKHGMAVLTDK